MITSLYRVILYHPSLFLCTLPSMNSALLNAYGRCTLCPHQCKVDRTSGEVGICGETATVRVAWSGLHRGEEPPISGDNGSGMIFFSGCPLHCQYCQNYQISGDGASGDVIGVEVSIEELCDDDSPPRDGGRYDQPGHGTPSPSVIRPSTVPA